MRLRLSTAFAVATLAVALPAAAQQAPANSGPHYILVLSDTNLNTAAGGTRTRQGDEAAVTVSFIRKADSSQDGIARIDMAFRFRCSQRMVETPVAAAYGLDGGFRGAFETSEGWQPVELNGDNAIAMAYACDGTLPEGTAPLTGDINKVAADYRRWAAGD